MTRNEILREFLRLSEVIHEKEEEGVITHDEAATAIDHYRVRADAVLDVHRKAQKVKH